MLETGLLRDVSASEIETYREHGVVRLKGVLPAGWVERLGRAIDREFPSTVGSWLVDPDLRDLVRDPRLGLLAARLTGASGVSFCDNQRFMKKPGMRSTGSKSPRRRSRVRRTTFRTATRWAPSRSSPSGRNDETAR